MSSGVLKTGPVPDLCRSLDPLFWNNGDKIRIILALGNTFLPTQLGNAVLTTKTGQHNPDLLFCGTTTSRLSFDVLHDTISIVGNSFVLSSHHLLLDSNDEPKSLP